MAAKPILEDLFLREKPARILLSMKMAKGPVYATILSKEADCTYSHTVKILNTLLNMGIINFEKKGRIKMVELTNDGWDIAHNIEAVRKRLVLIEEKFEMESKEKKKSKKKAEAAKPAAE
jgi:predicted transcriptional regulator